MKVTTKIDPNILRTMESENKKALRQILHNRDLSTIIPIHTANMSIYKPENDDRNLPKIRPTIIPPLAIYIDTKGIKNGKLSRASITYRIAYNNNPIPLSHVYNNSGSLCLGSIFVPAFVPVHSPQLPLETLFLHNDRNVNHGQPKLKLTQKQLLEIKLVLNSMMIPDKNYIKNKFPIDVTQSDWIATDMLWQIGAEMLELFPKHKALYNMNIIFQLVFPSEKKKPIRKTSET